MSNYDEISDKVIKSYILNSGNIKEKKGFGKIKEIKVVKKTKPQKIENSILFNSSTIITFEYTSENGQQVGENDEYSLNSSFTMQIGSVNLITTYTAIACNKSESLDSEDSINKNERMNIVGTTDNFGLYRHKGDSFLVHHMSGNLGYIEIMKLPKGHNLFLDAIPNDENYEWKKLDLGTIICDYNVAKEYKKALHS